MPSPIPGSTRTRRATALAAAAATTLLLLSGCSATASSSSASAEAAAEYDLIGGDKVLIATTASMPNTNLVNGDFVGFEAAMLTTALDNLGLEYEVSISDFQGMLGAAQTGRADVAVGNIAWRSERAETGLITDPPFYVPIVFAHQDGTTAETVDDLQGKVVGTVTGYLFVDALQDMDGIELRTFADATSVISDLEAGRIDVALLDPLAAIYTAESRPELNIVATPATPPTAAQIAADPRLEVFGPAMAGWFLPTGHEKLEAALDEEIRSMYADGTTERLMAENGIDDPAAFLSMPDEWLDRFVDQRIETDRDADWTAPTD